MVVNKKYICLMLVFLCLVVKRTFVYEAETKKYYSVKIIKNKINYGY
jgi:hypothetical protein